MRALVWQGPLRLELAEVGDPEPRAGEALVAPELVGICGSDVTAYTGKMGIARPGAIRGHEFGGTVVGGTAIDADGLGIAVGTRVAVNPVLPCGACPQCRRGAPTSCTRVEIVGVHRPGALAELVAVPAAQLHPLPEAAGWAEAASAEPLAQAIHDVELAAAGGRRLGSCLVIGGGSIGSWVASTIAGRLSPGARAGAPEVTVVDTDPGRHGALRALGADRVLGSLDEAAAGGRRFDTVIDAVGLGATRRRAIELADNGGVVVAVGLGEDEAPVSWFDLVRREITVLGANVFRSEDYALALAALCSGRTGLDRSPEPIPLADSPAAFAALAAGERTAGKVFVAPQR